jgi:hypothetical protein
MSRQTKYPPELRERAIRMVYEQREHHESVRNNSASQVRPPGEMVFLRGRRLLAAARFGQKEA